MKIASLKQRIVRKLFSVLRTNEGFKVLVHRNLLFVQVVIGATIVDFESVTAEQVKVCDLL